MKDDNSVLGVEQVLEPITRSSDLANHFGEHFTLDGYGGDQILLGDEALVNNILKELPASLGMHTLTEPNVVSAPDNGIKDPGGLSGFVIIAESHISVHTFPRRGFISADVYTCKNGMDIAFIEKFFREKFKLQDAETNFIKRGTRYPSANIYDN